MTSWWHVRRRRRGSAGDGEKVCDERDESRARLTVHLVSKVGLESAEPADCVDPVPLTNVNFDDQPGRAFPERVHTHRRKRSAARLAQTSHIHQPLGGSLQGMEL